MSIQIVEIASDQGVDIVEIRQGPAGANGPNSVTSATTSDGTANLSLAAASVSGTLAASHIHGNLAGSIYMHVRAGEALSKGDPVYVSGSHGTGSAMVPIVSRADASNAAKMPAIAIMDAAVANNGDGHAVINGTISDLNTAAYSVNATLYVANGGGLTQTKPANAQPVARVERSNTNNGGIVVKVNGLYSDVTIASSQVTDATSAATPSTIVKRSATGGILLSSTSPSESVLTATGVTAQPAIVATSTAGIGLAATSQTSTGFIASSQSSFYHSLFGISGDDRSFVARVKGAFGWFRGLYTGRIQSADTLTADRTYTLPDANGTVILDSTLGAGVNGLTTITGAKSFSGQVSLTGQAATDATSAMTRGMADARYGDRYFSRQSSTVTVTSSTAWNATGASLTVAAGTYRIQARVLAQVAANGNTAGGAKMRISGVTFTTITGRVERSSSHATSLTRHLRNIASASEVFYNVAAADFTSSQWYTSGDGGVWIDFDLIATVPDGTIALEVSQVASNAQSTLFIANNGFILMDRII